MPRSTNRLACFSPRPWPEVVAPTGTAGLFFPRGPVPPAHWRATLKAYLLTECDVCWCGEAFRAMPHMHEALITRGDVQGWSPEHRVIIQTPYNCVLLCAACHHGFDGKSTPSRERVLRHMRALYGSAVDRWLASLPFRVHPLRGLIDWSLHNEENMV